MTITLASLKIGQTAVITGFIPECRQEVRQRLLDLGFVRGSKIKIENVSPLSDPVAYSIQHPNRPPQNRCPLCADSGGRG